MRKVRSALWVIFERVKEDISSEDERLLFAELGLLGKARTITDLLIWRTIAFEFARAKSRRERQLLLQQCGAEKPYWLIYTTVAWVARTLALAENLERADLSMLPTAFAGEQTLLFMEKFEEDETWLWPFESEPPWPTDDDKDHNV